MVIALYLAASIARADSLELRNGSLIKGKFLGGTENEVSFQVGSSVQKYNLADIVSLKFDSERAASDLPARPSASFSSQSGTAENPGVNAAANVTIPAGTRISVRTIEGIDSTKNHVGDRFQASLEEPLMVDGNVVVAKGADVYGRLVESKESGTFTGRSQLRLELTGIVVNGQTVPVATGKYELTGKSRGASTAKRTVGGAGWSLYSEVPQTLQREISATCLGVVGATADRDEECPRGTPDSQRTSSQMVCYPRSVIEAASAAFTVSASAPTQRSEVTCHNRRESRSSIRRTHAP